MEIYSITTLLFNTALILASLFLIMIIVAFALSYIRKTLIPFLFNYFDKVDQIDKD